MSDPFIGEIRIFAGTFAPAGWALCQGQTMAINQWTALFSLLGTTYGGNGSTTFNLPDLRGRCVVGVGQLTGGSNYTEGQIAGVENVTLNSTNLPAHTHPFAQQANNGDADQNDPTGAIPAMSNTGGRGNETPSYTKNASTGSMAAQQTGVTGQSKPFSVQQPYLVINYIIALQGIYPSRS